MDWTQLELFKGIDLNDSFILNWALEGDQLTFELEASIWPESSYYSHPKSREHTCYRKAVLSFLDIKNINGLKPIEAVSSTVDPDGSKDYGNIDTLSQTENGYNISGNFGAVKIMGGVLRFEVHKSGSLSLIHI